MATPAKPRLSGLPGPKYSSIPTPGSRSRSSSVIGDNAPSSSADVEFMSRAFQDAIKANDPAQHRSLRQSDTGNASSFAPALSQSQYGRPPSVARNRPKIPSAAVRPPSRTSDVFGRSVSRAEKQFDVGDMVRIESLGMEGTVRYMGPIDGKEGLFAGVELSPGFSGRGKNDGSVSGKEYFRCADKCGVFVPYSKLSQPAVRPASVASMRNGRTTPSISTALRNGRATPSFSSGRITPSGRTTPAMSSGRITPGMTPSARPRNLTKSIAKTPTAKSTKTPVAAPVTPGSRAAKYAGMTAKQLGSTQNGQHESMNASPTRIGGIPSPIGSPYGTPKAKLGLGGRVSSAGTPTRPSGGTPRARLPSAVAMPPPASPSLSFASPSRSVSRSSDLRDEISSASEIARAGKALQDRMAELTSGTNGSASPSRSESVMSIRSEHKAQLERLQARLDALEYENERLRNTAAVVPSPPPPPPSPPASSSPTPNSDAELAVKSDAEHDKLEAQITDLQTKLDRAIQTTQDGELKMDSLIKTHQTALAELEKQKDERSQIADELQVKLDDAIGELQKLLQTIQTKEEEEQRHNQIALEKDAQLVESQKRYTKALSTWEDERKDLIGQVDELRQAGQETIALYEEKLNDAEAQKYELNARVTSLQATLHRRSTSQASSTIASSTITSAAEIDNETLREHITHLQKRITSLEDQLEDQRITADRDDATAQERLKRAKEKEDGVKKELIEMKKEMDRVIKAEMQARTRVDEVEEALRENGVALENARAEVEVIRAEMADLDGLVGNSVEGDLHARVAETVERASADKKRYTDEIQRLQKLLDSRGSDTADDTTSSDTLRLLESKNAELEKLSAEYLETLENEKSAREALQRSLNERTSELDNLKKKFNREHGVNGPTQAAPSVPTVPKSDLVSAKDEIKGLKHIVQELQKENSASAQREQVLESENQLLTSEAEQLRQEIKILEENLDQSFSNEDGNPMSPSLSNDAESLRTSMREQKAKFEAELAQQRKKVVDAEQKAARTVHDLNKEISELEALVESKIYREDELEQEIERLKRQRKSAKASAEPPTPIERNPRASTASTASFASSFQDVCEICEKPGHDIFNCDMLKDDSKTSRPVSVSSAVDLFCEDCEGHGHVAADCPHSLDVF